MLKVDKIKGRRFGLAICIMLLVIQCRTRSVNPLDGFVNKQEQLITGEDVHLASDTILFRPFDLKVYDTVAVICDNTGEAGYTMLNVRTGQLIKKFAFAGSDPSEFDINAISMSNAIHDTAVFTLTQVNPPNKIVIYKWDSLLKKPVYKPGPFFTPEKFGYSQSVLLNDSVLLGRFSFSKFDNKMFGIVNIASNKLITGIEVPGLNDKASNRKYEDSPYYKWMNNVVEDRFINRPGGNYEFACFTFRGASIKIFNVDKDYHFNMKYEKDFYLPSFYLSENAGTFRARLYPYSKNGFSSITATRDKIYALYNGPLLNDSEENKDISNLVLVYDWNGNPLEKIKLDRKCGRIAIDENNTRFLYGLYGPTGAQIVKYRLPLN